MDLIFRKIVLATLFAYIVLMLLPYAWGFIYSQAIMDALSWWGYGGVLNIYGFIPYVLASLYIISLLGIYFFKKWARKLFLVTVIASGIISPLWGLNMMPNIDAIFAHIYGLGTGAILALSYFSEVRKQFEKET